MRSTFDKLSVEIIVEIMSYLNYLDITRCRAVRN